MIVRIQLKGLLRRLWRRLVPRTEPVPAPAILGESTPEEPVPTPPQLPPPRRGERTLIVGVDFGTSSTKVIWQDLSDNQFEMFPWNPATRGLSAYLLPSTVVIRAGAIHFGLSHGDVCQGEIRLSSIKLCVLCRSNPSICRCGNSAARDGVVRLPGLEAHYPASVFACLFLAHVFREVESRLVRQFPKDNLLLIWNIGCPMDYLDEANRKNEWERMAGVAMELHRDLPNQATTSQLAEVAESLNRFVVPPADNRNYFVQPEGLAAVKAFLESPYAESKTYAIVDVGAGTTEVSFFFNGRIMTEPDRPLCPSYLADTTAAVGGGKIDLELARVWDCTTEEARLRKEAGESKLPSIPSIGEVCIQYERTCFEIVRCRKLTAANDKRFDLFVIGGGGRFRPLQEALRGRPLPGGCLREGWRQLQAPKALKNRVAIQSDYDFLANACGLASSLSWDYYPPREVSPMASLPMKPKPDFEEYYPK